MPLLPPQNGLYNFSSSEVPDLLTSGGKRKEKKKDVDSSTIAYPALSTGGKKEQKGLTDLTEYSLGSFSILTLELSLQ